MNPWNRLRRLAEGIFAGGGARAAADDAVYLTEAAYRNRRPASASAPEIRERHFGLGVRRRKVVRAAAGEPASYARTRIVGTPLKPEAPTAAPKPGPAAPGGKAGKAPQSRREEARPAPVPAPALAPDDDAMLRRLFGEPQKQQKKEEPEAVRPAPAPAVRAKRKKMDRGDVVVAALGVTLAVTCAVFPWYIFFNQEKFGVREFVFSGGGSGQPASGFAYQPQPLGKPFASNEVPKMELDFFPTATLPADQGPARAVPASEQPFPADLVAFRLVHVANGRAMIEDADGLWVVQRGSRLPDSSRVVSIEQREGRWVLLTSQDGIVEIDAN